MSRAQASLAAGACASLLLLASAGPGQASASTTPQAAFAWGASASRPLAFEPNRGQGDARGRFLARSNLADVFLTQAGAVLALRGRQSAPAMRTAPAPSSWLPDWLTANAQSAFAVDALALRIRFIGANPHPRIEGVDLLPGHSNYLIGKDPRQWQTDVPQYRAVRYRDLLPGVDVVYYGKDGQLEFDVAVAPGADLSQVRLRIDGADALALDADGNLRVHTAFGEMIQRKPVVYQTVAGERRDIAGGYVLLDGDRAGAAQEVAFVVPEHDRRAALVLDPTLVWTAQTGGSVGDGSYGAAADNGGNWYFTGFSDHSATVNFPTTVGAYQTANNGGSDAFVRKVSNDGTTVLYSTLIGGSGNDIAYGIGVDDAGNAYIAGTTYSANFPTTPGAVQTTDPSGANVAGFVASLNAAGNALNYSTYLGGTSGFIVGTSANHIAVDAAGNAFVTGETTTDNLPTSPDSFQPQPATSGNTSAFVFKFDASGARVFGTYLVDDYLGFGGDHGAKIAIDDQGNSYVVGYTGSHFGGTYNGVARTLLGPGGGTYDMLVARLNRTGKWLDWVAHIGGGSLDKGTAIAVDGGHQVMVAGWSASSDLPPAITNNDDWGWIGQLDENGSQVLDAAWIGAAGAATFPEAIVWDELIVAGSVQKPSALPALGPIAGLDCASQCGGNSTYGGFFALLTTGPLTLQSLTRVLGATGSDTRFHGLAQDATSASGRTAAAGGSNGTFPGTSPGDTSQAAVAAVVDTRAAVATPPRVKKYFEPATVEPGKETTLTITVYNAKSSPATISDFDLEDNLPVCMQFVKRVGGSLLAAVDSSGRVFITLQPSSEILPGSYKFVQIRVKAGAVEGPCTNTTGTATTNVGPAEPASATLNIASKSCKATSTGTCSSMNMSDPACWSGSTPPANSCDAEIAACTGGPCNINNDQAADRKIDRLIFDGATSVTGATLYLGGGLTLPNPVDVAIAPPLSAAAGTLDIDVASPGAHLTTSEIRIYQTYAYFNGQGTTAVSGSITGVGQVNVLGGNVMLAASPTFTGQLNVLGGALTTNAPVPEKTFLDGGLLRGVGPFAAIEQSGGILRPGTGTTPTTVDVGDLTLLSKLMLDLGPGNATHSSVNATGNVLLSGMTVQLNFATEPAVNATFSNLITSPGGSIVGCPQLVVASQNNLVLAAQCTPFSVGATVFSNERVFLGNFQF